MMVETALLIGILLIATASVFRSFQKGLAGGKTACSCGQGCSCGNQCTCGDASCAGHDTFGGADRYGSVFDVDIPYTGPNGKIRQGHS